MNKVLIAMVTVVLLAVGGWVVFGSNDKKDHAGPAQNQTTSSDTATLSNQSNTNLEKVSIENMLFTPAQITIKKGTTVTWTNNEDTNHTVTSDTEGVFDSGSVAPGKSFSTTFNNIGSFPYHCNFHSAMHGTVVVQ